MQTFRLARGERDARHLGRETDAGEPPQSESDEDGGGRRCERAVARRVAGGEGAGRQQQTGRDDEPRQRDELEVEPGPVRPFFIPTPESSEIYEQARALAKEIGFDPEAGVVGGGSDGNFTGAIGVPTLDGLGPEGAGFHTAEEHVLVDSLIPRARLLSGLLRTLS